MTYQTKAERRAREEMLRTLGKEFRQAVNKMASQYTYAGTAYEHVARELREITERTIDVYLDRTPTEIETT